MLLCICFQPVHLSVLADRPPQCCSVLPPCLGALVVDQTSVFGESVAIANFNTEEYSFISLLYCGALRWVPIRQGKFHRRNIISWLNSKRILHFPTTHRKDFLLRKSFAYGVDSYFSGGRWQSAGVTKWQINNTTKPTSHWQADVRVVVKVEWRPGFLILA